MGQAGPSPGQAKSAQPKPNDGRPAAWGDCGQSHRPGRHFRETIRPCTTWAEKGHPFIRADRTQARRAGAMEPASSWVLIQGDQRW